MAIKPGWLTSEFLSTQGLNIVLMLLALLVKSGVLSPDLGNKWEPLIKDFVALACVVMAAFNQQSYNKGRAEVKVAEQAVKEVEIRAEAAKVEAVASVDVAKIEAGGNGK